MKHHENPAIDGRARRFLAFAGFTLDATQRLLFGADGKPVPLTARAFDILLFMVEHPGELLEKRTLMKAAWPDAVVEENNLNQNIAVLRRALGEAPAEHRFIVTIPARGFRFVATVTQVDSLADARSERESDPASTSPDFVWTRRRMVGVAVGGAIVLAVGFLVWERMRAQDAGRVTEDTSVVVAAPTIAVLPFTDLSPNKDQEYFADGLTEELGSQIARIPGVRVIGRRSAFAFKTRNEDLRKIGASLGVKHLLEGSIRKAEDQLRITAQLVDAADGTRLWSNTYERTLGDVFAIQDEIAKAVAVALSGTLRAGNMDRVIGGTRNVAAFDAYLAGRTLRNTSSLESSIAALERAVSLDPQFALAWSWLARAYQAGGLIPEREREWRAKEPLATARALKLAPDLPSVLAAAANTSMQQRKWAEAELYLLRALERGRDADAIAQAYGFFLLNVGRPREAVEYYRRDKLLEPLLADPAMMLAIAYEMSGHLDQADAELAATAGLVGDRKLIDLAKIMVALARRDSAEMRNVIAALPDDAYSRAVKLGIDQPDAARVALRRLATQDPYRRPPWIWGIAHWAAYFGDYELSLRSLRTGLGAANLEGSSTLTLWRPVEKETRRLPAFKDLVRDLGLLDYWRESGKWDEFCRPVGADDFECT